MAQSKILIIYYSRSGNTKKMAQIIADGMQTEGMEVALKEVEKVRAEELLEVDGIVIGSPVYYGSMSSQIKELFDQTVKFHGRLDGKIGGAFSSSANIAGGNETTILDILNAMLIHGMIIQGDPKGDHYGPVAISNPDSRSTKQCMRFASRIAKLVKKLAK